MVVPSLSLAPAGKTWDTFEHDRTSSQLRQQLQRLGEGDFVDRGVNVLAFGIPGTGKTHAICAIGHGLVESGRSVLFIPAYRLVQDMLAAKRDLELPRMLRKLDNFDLLVIDDLGYLPQGAGESEVLFTLIAERYERRSLEVTSNLVFSEWEKVFANGFTYNFDSLVKTRFEEVPAISHICALPYVGVVYGTEAVYCTPARVRLF